MIYIFSVIVEKFMNIIEFIGIGKGCLDLGIKIKN